MSVSEKKSDRMDELREFVRLLLPVIHQFKAEVGLELNFSCPTSGVDPSSRVLEAGEALPIAAPLRIPLLCKFNALAPVDAVCEISKEEACGAIVMGNTIPWGAFPGRIDWNDLFWNNESPLARFGGGGLSGPPLRSIHCEWLRTALDSGLCKPVIGCGGIDSAQAVEEYYSAGASGIQVATACMLRPGRTRAIANMAYR